MERFGGDQVRVAAIEMQQLSADCNQLDHVIVSQSVAEAGHVEHCEAGRKVFDYLRAVVRFYLDYKLTYCGFSK